MKRYSLYLLLILLSVTLFLNCSDDNESYSNKVFVNAKAMVDKLLIKPSAVNEERTIKIALAKPETKDIIVTCKVDESLVSKYNQAYHDDAIILPATYYDLPVKEALIKAGTVSAVENIVVYFKNINQLDRDLIYVLPISISDANIGVLESARTTYFVFRGAALINVVSDIEDNSFHIDQWTKPAAVNNLPQLTLEALVRCRNYDRQISTVMGIEGGFLIRLGDAGFPSNQIQIATNNGNFPDADSNKGLPINAWTHIAVTYDSSNGNLKVYVNGKLQSEGIKQLGNVNLGINGADGFYIGRSYANDRFLAGEISECRIWNVVRTQEEIAGNPYEVAADESGLVAYWRCDEGSGVTIKDHTGNGNHLTARKDVKWTPVSLPASK